MISGGQDHFTLPNPLAPTAQATILSDTVIVLTNTVVYVSITDTTPACDWDCDCDSVYRHNSVSTKVTENLTLIV